MILFQVMHILFISLLTWRSTAICFSPISAGLSICSLKRWSSFGEAASDKTIFESKFCKSWMTSPFTECGKLRHSSDFFTNAKDVFQRKPYTWGLTFVSDFWSHSLSWKILSVQHHFFIVCCKSLMISSPERKEII